MSDRLSRVTAKQIISVLESCGFFLARQSGSHMIYRHENGMRTTVPFHGSTILHPKILKSIMKDASISDEQLKELL